MPSQDKQFTNFKIHTQYSICEGAVKIDELAEMMYKADLEEAEKELRNKRV